MQNDVHLCFIFTKRRSTKYAKKIYWSCSATLIYSAKLLVIIFLCSIRGYHGNALDTYQTEIRMLTFCTCSVTLVEIIFHLYMSSTMPRIICLVLHNLFLIYICNVCHLTSIASLVLSSVSFSRLWPLRCLLRPAFVFIGIRHI